MGKRSLTEIIIAVALIAGAGYYLFYTERGRQWLERLQSAAADKLDELLELLEQELTEMELSATEAAD